jgi:N-acetyl sugar amidotransferase
MQSKFYQLPNNIEFCKSCVISNQRPSSVVEFKHTIKQKKPTIKFQNGVCSACNYKKIKNEIDWGKREKLLETLLDKHRKSNGSYDVIVPGSGGKDSGYVSHLLKNKYGMNPLTVTWSPHLYTEIGKINFYNWINHGGLDNILFTPNGSLQRYLTKEAFKNLLHPFQPFIIGQRMIGPKFAIKYNVKLIMYGETAGEYGGNQKENKIPIMNEKFYTDQKDNKLYFGGKTINEILKKTNYKLSDFNPYLPLEKSEMKNKKFEVHHMNFYKFWDPQENFYYASKNLNFLTNQERTTGTYSKYSSLDDKIDDFHYYTTYIKFGLGRATYDACQEIRARKITRKEGIGLVKLYDGEFPQRYFDDFLDYTKIDKETFFKIINKFRSNHLWKKIKKNKYQLRKTVY